MQLKEGDDEVVVDFVQSISLTSDGGGISARLNSTSMWPVMAQFMNLPNHLRNCYENCHPWLLIPDTPKNLETYLTVIVDELQQLFEHGVDMYVSGVGKCLIKALLSFMSADLKAIPKMTRKKADNCKEGACLMCDTKGVRFCGRQVYPEGIGRLWDIKDTLNPSEGYTDVSVFTACLPYFDLSDSLYYCWGHGMKNMCLQVFELMGTYRCIRCDIM